MSKMRDVTIEEVDILPGSWRNFAGEERKFNARGARNFNIALSKENAEKMAAQGWNVKQRDPLEDGDEPLYYLQVSVNFGGRPPKIVLITEYVDKHGNVSKRKTHLDEDMVSQLDYAVIITADIVLHPYEWEVNGNSGVKAYLNTLYAEIEVNDVERKWGRYDDNTEPQQGSDDLPPWDA